MILSKALKSARFPVLKKLGYLQRGQLFRHCRRHKLMDGASDLSCRRRDLDLVPKYRFELASPGASRLCLL
jgi:hypothetical protein